MTRAHAVLSLVMLAQSLALAAQTPAPPEPCADQAEFIGILDGAIERRPDDANLHYYRAAAWAACGAATTAVAALDRAAELGRGFLPFRDGQFDSIWDDPAFQQRRRQFEQALPRATTAKLAWQVRGGRELIPEGIAYDAVGGRLFIGSIAQGRILVRERDGRQREFAGPEHGLAQVLGLAVDAGRQRLYAVSTNRVLADDSTVPANAVIEFDLSDGRVLRRLTAADAGQLNDVTISSDGQVFASDSRGGAIYHAGLDQDALSVWLPAGSLPSVNGLALAAGDRALYAAHGTGIARIELTSRAITPRLSNATGETLAAIDGLYRHGDQLIGIHNYTHPGRVIALRLTADGGGVASVRTLLSHHHPALAEPTTGAVAGDRFMVLANSYVSRLQDDGRIKDAGSLRDPVVLSLPLNAAAD